MLGVLRLRKGLPAIRDRLSRLCRLRSPGPQRAGAREEDKATISWKIKFRDGREKNFVSPIRTTPWGSIKSPADYEAPSAEAMKSQQLAHEPEALKVTALPALSRDRFKQGLG